MDVTAWLQGLGLERYETAFRDNEIDWQVLPSPTADDLNEIGILAVGHRRRLLDAIDALRTAAEPAPAPPFAEGAERRQLTVMAVDAVARQEVAGPAGLRGGLRDGQAALLPAAQILGRLSPECVKSAHRSDVKFADGKGDE
jgi:SAM domain (Sterile alpha motif)